MSPALLCIIAVSLLPAAHAQLLSDATGLVSRLDVEAAGGTFEVRTVANFDVTGHEYEGGVLTLHVSSGLERSLGEVVIPAGLMRGEFAVSLDGGELEARVASSERIAFVTLNFTGAGEHRIEISATESLQGAAAPGDGAPAGAAPAGASGGGCLVATAAHGSELAPAVQKLREIRDTRLLSTGPGAAFVGSFNAIYYSFSPAAADLVRASPALADAVRAALAPAIYSLHLLGYAEPGSDAAVLALGSAVIALNAVVYAAAPALALVAAKRRLCAT